MIIRLFACAEHVLIDQQFNDATLVNLLDEVSGAAFPFVIPLFQFLAVVDRNDEEAPEHFGQVKFKLGDQILFDSPVNIDFVDQPRTRCVGTIRGFALPTSGDLEATITISNVEAKWVTRVKSTSQPELTMKSATPARGSKEDAVKRSSSGKKPRARRKEPSPA